MGRSREEIKRRLEPTHLHETLDVNAAKKEIEQHQEEKADEEIKPSDNLKMQRKYTFQFSWKDGRGKNWNGEFVNEVLSIKQRQMVGILRARMAAGIPVTALDELTQEVNLMIAHMSYSLVERPQWAEDLQALDDIRLLQELYQEVLAHEAIFLGYQKPQAAS